MLRVAPLLVLVAVLGAPGHAQDPTDASWIWGGPDGALDRPAGERCRLVRTLDLGGAVRAAPCVVSADNSFVLTVNGTRVAKGGDWTRGVRVDLAPHLGAGTNTLEVEAANSGGPAGFVLAAAITLEDGSTLSLVSDGSWEARPSDGPAFPAHVLAPYGAGTWGTIQFLVPPETDLAKRFETREGESVELAWDGLDSLVALTSHPDGDLFAAVENGPVLRLADDDGDGLYERTVPYTDAVRGCHGLCWTREGWLACVGNGPAGMGLYRVDPGTPEAPVLLGLLPGGGEHGPHGVIEGPDGTLFVAVGNHANVPQPWHPDSPFTLYPEARLLPRLEDPNGHANGITGPGGVVASLVPGGDPRWTVIAGGLRNAYDLARTPHGALFTFDSDMEWDLGLPWYREVRLVHVVPGGDSGWRTGSGKWPAWYPDAVPPACEVGRGSPTGVLYHDGAVLAADWSRGRILRFELAPDGVSYGARAEVLVRGRPLNVTDLAVDHRGALLFSTGGRGTEGAVFRLVSGHPPADVEPPAAPWPALFEDPLAALADGDPFVRLAAGRQLEREGVDADVVRRVDDPSLRARALLAAARVEQGRSDPLGAARALHEALRLFYDTRDGDLALLRAIEVLASDPDVGDPWEHRGIGRLALSLYPTGERGRDRLLAAFLAHWEPPGATAALLAELAANPSRAERLHVANALRTCTSGWDDSGRAAFASFLVEARTWTGGQSFRGYVDALAEAARPRLGAHAELLDRAPPAAPAPPVHAHAPREFDRLLDHLRRTVDAPVRSAAEGARVFAATCARCHTYPGIDVPATGGLGPDLAQVGARMARADLVEAIAQPSRRIADLYRMEDLFFVGGGTISGRPVREDAEEIVLLLSDGTRETIPFDFIEDRRDSPTSLMPDGLLDGLTLGEVADLLHLLESNAPAPPPADDWSPLFPSDGSLAGWSGDPALWRVTNGVVEGRGADLPTSSFLLSEATWSDFVLECELRVEGNSGIQFRSRPTGQPFDLAGYQADAGETYWGSLYEKDGRGIVHLTPPDTWQPVLDPEGWNHLRVEARGPRITIHLNGTRTTDLRDEAHTAGRLGFQLHAGDSAVWIRHARVREL